MDIQINTNVSFTGGAIAGRRTLQPALASRKDEGPPLATGHVKLLWILIGLVFLPYLNGNAETVYLKDGSFFECSITHFYENSLHVVLASGDTLILNRNELAKIVFSDTSPTTEKNPPPKASKNEVGDSAYATPKKTFETWRHALMKGELEAMANCFIGSARPLMLQKLREIPDLQRQAMIDEANKTKFHIDDLKTQGDRANLTIRRVLNKNTQKEELALVREGRDWKLVPNE